MKRWLTFARAQYLVLASAFILRLGLTAYNLPDPQPPGIPPIHTSSVPLLPVALEHGTTATPPIDDLVAGLLQIRQDLEAKSERRWRPPDSRLAKEVLQALADRHRPRLQELREDLARIAPGTAMRWVENNRKLIEFAQTIQESDSFLHPDQLEEMYELLLSLPASYEPLEKKLLDQSRPYWHSLLARYRTTQTMLAKLPSLDISQSAEEIAADIPKFDAYTSGPIRDQGTVLRLLLLYQLYVRLK